MPLEDSQLARNRRRVWESSRLREMFEGGRCLAYQKFTTVLYHQPEKMAKSKEDLAERQENLEKLKRQHGIE